MIDVIQWRASIGLWNYCQYTAGPTRHCIRTESTPGKKKKTVSLSLSPLIALLLFLLILITGYLEYNPPSTGIVTHCLWSKVQCTDTITDNWLRSGFTINTCDSVYPPPHLRLLLLLSGDVELNPGPITGNPKDILRTYFDRLIAAISIDLSTVTDALYTKGLIPLDTKRDMYALTGEDDFKKTGKLVIVLQTELEASLTPDQYLIDICHVLINQQHQTLTDIATNILHQLGQSAGVPISLMRDEVKGYADIMRGQYKHQPIIATDWPPRVGGDFFGRLALVEKQDSIEETDSAWYLLRGQVDKIVKMTEYKELSVEDILKPTNSLESLRVVIDGPPGIGKTILCRKLLNMWSNGTLPQQYDLILYCPLRNSKIATATTLTDLFVHRSYKVPIVSDWFMARDGKGLLILFDGWDELSTEHRQSSLVASIICREQLDQCAVIVTSRSYASSSLLDMTTISRHVQVIGFTENEISTVIVQTLQKDPKLAQELIAENKTDKGSYKWPFTTTQSSKDSQLAMKLINDLKVRGDVRSLCYVPLVCSMVILVYLKEGGHLPTTLTQLYQNFILQTIRRHVKRHDANPRTLGSLSSLPSQLVKPFQEMCQIAYTNLTNERMTFSSHDLHQLSLSEAVKDDYLGLMTAFTEYGEEKYQFLHLSIQEFLAAWWIAKHEKTEQVFKTHFDDDLSDDHFRMCLRFVAGLTHLEHENYQRYFDKQLNLRCKRNPLSLGIGSSFFHQNTDIEQCHSSFRVDDSDNFSAFLIQLLYESQNTTLCEVLAQSINNHVLCLRRVLLSLFDWLCLSYFMNNSSSTWNHLHLGGVDDQTLSVFTAGLTNSSLQTIRLGVDLTVYNDELVHTFFQTSLLYNVQEFYCDMKAQPSYIHLFRLPKLKILHLRQNIDVKFTDWNGLEKCIEMNSSIEEIKFECSGNGKLVTSVFTSVIRGVTRNNTVTSLTLDASCHGDPPPPLPDGVIEQLLKDNNTLQALSIHRALHNALLASFLNIQEEEVNTPLKALAIRGGSRSHKLMRSLLPHIKGLHCLILPEPHPPHLLFLSHPTLHTLELPLYTAESAIELFTVLQTNTILKALRVLIEEEGVYTSSAVGTSLQDMLTQNQTLKYHEINNERYNPISSSFLPFLTTGLIHNTSLQQLRVHITLPINEEIKTFINVISQKNNLTELQVTFSLDQLNSNHSREEKEQIMTLLYYEQALPAVTNMLQSHTTIRILGIHCKDLNESSQPNWIEVVQHLYETIFIHPSLEYIEIITGYLILPPLLVDTLKDQIKTLIHRHRKEQPYRPIPIVQLGTGNDNDMTGISDDDIVSTKLEEKLDIKDLDEIITTLHKGEFSSSDWHEFGGKLGLLESDLRTIEHDKNDADLCLRIVLKTWLQTSINATYKGLVDALIKMEKKAVADYITNNLNPELFNKEILENYERTIKESGLLTYSVSTAIVQGEAQIGKTCLKSLIMSLPYEEVSTNCIEAPCIAYRYASTDGKCWKLVTDDDIDKKIITEIQKLASEGSASTDSDSTPIIEAIPNTDSDSTPIIEAIPNKESNTDPITQTDTLTSVTPNTLHIASSNEVAITEIMPNVMSQEMQELNDQEHNGQDNNATGETKQTATPIATKDIFKHCLEVFNIERYGSHREWLYFIDSGGQIQFQKLLLAFMPCTTTLILVVNLSKNLSDLSSSVMKLSQTEHIKFGSKYSLKVEDVLKQVLSAVVSNARQYRSALRSSNNITFTHEKLSVISVGTHHDEYDKMRGKGDLETLKEKQVKLRSILSSVKGTCIIIYANDNEFEPLHIIDGRKAAVDCCYTDETIEKISTSLKDRKYKIEVPLKWHYFSVLLRKEAQKTNGVLTVSSCETFGIPLGMTNSDVHSALKFFHILKVLFYYDDSPAKDIVFVKLDSLINIIRELVIEICKSRSDQEEQFEEEDVRKLAIKSYLSIATLKSCQSFIKIADALGNDFSTNLLGLFEHLKIAAKLPEGEFLMPALLPVGNVSDTQFLPEKIRDTIPLLFYFTTAVPMGLYCAVIVHLLSDPDTPWTIISESEHGNFSNYFTLERNFGHRTGLSVEIVLIEKLNCIEVYCDRIGERHKVTEAIEKAIDEVMKKKLINMTPTQKFYCPCTAERRGQHTAKVENKVNIKCDIFGSNQSNKMSEDTCQEYWSWFMNKQEYDKRMNERKKFIDGKWECTEISKGENLLENCFEDKDHNNGSGIMRTVTTTEGQESYQTYLPHLQSKVEDNKSDQGEKETERSLNSRDKRDFFNKQRKFCVVAIGLLIFVPLLVSFLPILFQGSRNHHDNGPLIDECLVQDSNVEKQASEVLDISDLNIIVKALEESNFSKAKWFSLGLKLDVLHNDLETIEMDYPRDAQRCLTECLAKWLKSGKATYTGLVNALKNMEENLVAKNILSMDPHKDVAKTEL